MRKPLNKTDTPMLFRVDREGVLFALLIREPGTYDPATCASYAHFGQHSSANVRGCIEESRPATAAEIWPLKQELRSLGYCVAVRTRATGQDQAARSAALERKD